MKIELHRYALESKGRLNSLTDKQGHKGVLFKVTFKNGEVGYSDCHPWPELGDFPVDLHLKLLKLGHLTRLTDRTLEFARIDARARAESKSLFVHSKIPLSHALLTDLDVYTDQQLEDLIHQGFQRIKVKVHKNGTIGLQRLLKLLRGTLIKLRLDFNGKLTRGEFEAFLEKLGPSLSQIEFFEDPIPFNIGQWKELRKKYNISLACDRESIKAIGFRESADYIVVKPAVQKPEQFFNDQTQKVVMTTYVDHPLGQMTAAWTAAQFTGSLDVCGLLTHHVYQSNPFSILLHNEGPSLHAPEGTGFGFDYLLNKLEWTQLL